MGLRRIERAFAAVERFGAGLARRQKLAAVACAMLVLLVRAAELPRMPIPEPWVHDEFSYLLAADTFASGRLTNLTHPLWPHFESFHIIQVPSYMSMYFPGQGLALAFGQVVFGRPWIGVYLSVGLFCGLLCWMLEGWLPPGWALLGALLAAMRIGVFGGWMNSYFGTQLAGIGGALVLGALPRILRRPRARHALAMGLGLAILANTRPYEGMLAAIPVALSLAAWMMRGKVRLWAALAKVAAPLVLVLLPTAAAICYYDWRVTGDPFHPPYLVNREMYAVAPLFLWQPMRPEPLYRHEVMRTFYTRWEPGFQNAAHQTEPAVWFRAAGSRLLRIWSFFLGWALSIPLIMLPWALRDRRIRFWVWAGAVFAAGFGVQRYLQASYVAPMAGGLYVVAAQSMRHLRQVRFGRWRAGLWLVRMLVLVCAGTFLQRVATPAAPSPYPGNTERAGILQRLEGLPGNHLVIVRYGSSHNLGMEWVYNRADIDRAKVVWAREMGPEEDARLLAYFRGRQAWLLEADQDPPKLTSYPLR